MGCVPFDYRKLRPVKQKRVRGMRALRRKQKMSASDRRRHKNLPVI